MKIEIEQAQLNILLVEDHPLTLLGVQHLLERSDWPCFQTVEITTAASQQEAQLCLQRVDFDVAIIDIYLPDGHGFMLSRQMLKIQPGLRVIFFSGSQALISQMELLQAGARGYVNKNMAPQHLVAAILTVYYGGLYLQSEQLLQIGTRPEADASLPEALSRREAQVLTLLAEDCGKHEIAHQLGISVRTVETYRARLMKKLNCRSLVGLIRYALNQGLIEPGQN